MHGFTCACNNLCIDSRVHVRINLCMDSCVQMIHSCVANMTSRNPCLCVQVRSLTMCCLLDRATEVGLGIYVISFYSVNEQTMVRLQCHFNADGVDDDDDDA